MHRHGAKMADGGRFARDGVERGENRALSGGWDGVGIEKREEDIICVSTMSKGSG